MLRGLYTAASGMLSATVGTDTLAHNLANVNTVGFKGSKLNYQSFPEMLITRMGKQGTESIGSLMTGNQVKGTFINYAPGAMRATGNTFDLALEGDGFFTVKTDKDETYYTRAGNFTMNEEGYLTTMNGDYVQGEAGNIQVNSNQGKVSINRQGEVFIGQNRVDKLKIGRFENNQMLEKVGDTFYKETPVSKPLTPQPGDKRGYSIHQGTLEESNVNAVSELVNNIQGLRLYEALQKNIHIHNETLGKAVNEVGRSSR